MAESWTAQLRTNNAYNDNVAKLLNTEGRDRFDAAKALLDDMDRSSPQVYVNLRKGDAVYRAYECTSDRK